MSLTKSSQIGRLMKFQEACLVSTSSHRLDGWMVRFLLDHAVELEDRDSLSDMNIQHLATNRGRSGVIELRELGRYANLEPLQSF